MKLYLADPPKFLKLSEAAQALGISYRTAQRWAQDGSLPCVRWEGRRTVRVPLSELQRLEKA